MKKAKIGAFDVFGATMATLSSQGALLLAGTDETNPMTIGWATMGISWGKPVLCVMIRPSRYTFGLMEKATTFSVNIPSESLNDVCMLCGSKSGRDVDKIAEAGLTVQPGRAIEVPTLMDCPIHYECSIIHSSVLNPQSLVDDIINANYRAGDHHKVYWGEIVGVFRRT